MLSGLLAASAFAIICRMWEAYSEVIRKNPRDCLSAGARALTKIDPPSLMESEPVVAAGFAAAGGA